MRITFGSRSIAALGRKVSDEFIVPLCRGHHREVHRSGDEASWWKKAGIDPTVAARTLWLETHPLPTAPDKTGLDRRDFPRRCRRRSEKPQAWSAVGRRGPKCKTKPITSFPQI